MPQVMMQICGWTARGPVYPAFGRANAGSGRHADPAPAVVGGRCDTACRIARPEAMRLPLGGFVPCVGSLTS
jgi:hypothetical protein